MLSRHAARRRQCLLGQRGVLLDSLCVLHLAGNGPSRTKGRQLFGISRFEVHSSPSRTCMNRFIHFRPHAYLLQSFSCFDENQPLARRGTRPRFCFGRVLVPVTYLRNFCTTCRHMTFKSLAKSGCVGAEWDRTPIFGEQISLGNEFLIAP
jgi:hypothetical protein